MKKAVLITAAGSVSAIEIDAADELAQLQSLVGGYVEVLPLGGLDMWCNDSGKLELLPFNRVATALYTFGSQNLDAIAGDVVITGPVDNEGESTSITLDEVESHLRIVLAAQGVVGSLRASQS